MSGCLQLGSAVSYPRAGIPQRALAPITPACGRVRAAPGSQNRTPRRARAPTTPNAEAAPALAQLNATELCCCGAQSNNGRSTAVENISYTQLTLAWGYPLSSFILLLHMDVSAVCQFAVVIHMYSGVILYAWQAIDANARRHVLERGREERNTHHARLLAPREAPAPYHPKFERRENVRFRPAGV
jgi:hypothetical protein